MNVNISQAYRFLHNHIITNSASSIPGQLDISHEHMTMGNPYIMRLINYFTIIFIDAMSFWIESCSRKRVALEWLLFLSPKRYRIVFSLCIPGIPMTSFSYPFAMLKQAGGEF
ncbi:unnamed protein product [Orchesella dallaii]|uniref:Uncharacterized protein n=1 Tax=Orchesella dallaii TaxID=48710 RepID=A0ABP1RA57_9HEXA